ncbi:hypothetical protein M9H77_06526 [Catharanthus roseus]|uniref:Uncharacterized protein n=1 Tax=Catharanthus roseus TaxID=4058 RepID=A0ACC0BSF1_CATRO|nr:hypothetical protein M9H77_06526 [Catharanthus roseus]
MKANTYLIINRYKKSITSYRRPYVTLACEHRGAVRKNTKPIVDDEEEVPIKKRRPYRTKNAARLTEEQSQQTEQFRKSHVPPQGRNMVEEVLCLSAQRGYTVFYRNRDESNVLSDIIAAHPISIAMIRTWPYVLIMDTTYKTNKSVL